MLQTKEEILAAIGQFVTGQGNQVGVEGLTDILTGIVGLVPEGGGSQRKVIDLTTVSLADSPYTEINVNSFFQDYDLSDLDKLAEDFKNIALKVKQSTGSWLTLDYEGASMGHVIDIDYVAIFSYGCKFNEGDNTSEKSNHVYLKVVQTLYGARSINIFASATPLEVIDF